MSQDMQRDHHMGVLGSDLCSRYAWVLRFCIRKVHSTAHATTVSRLSCLNLYTDVLSMKHDRNMLSSLSVLRKLDASKPVCNAVYCLSRACYSTIDMSR